MPIFKIKQPWCDGRCDQWYDGAMEEKEAKHDVMEQWKENKQTFSSSR